MRVVDGDTVDVRYRNQLLTVRLQGIDSPEKDQPFGGEATLHLSKLVQGKMVSILYENHDRYGRLLGKILVGDKTGEGVFGVSFKIKGPPKDLETTVNPIKTLTPRFITRTLEKIKRN